MSVEKPRARTYYVLFVRMRDSYYMAKIHGEWERVGSHELGYPKFREAVQLPSMQAVRNALASTEGKRILSNEGKYIVAKHTIEIVEDTLDPPLKQLASAAE